MTLKYISWLLLVGSIVGTIAYFNVFDRMTRHPLRVLWVESPHARDLRNILDEFTDRTNISVQVDSVPRELYRKAINREMDTDNRQYDIVIGDGLWEPLDVSRGYYEQITDIATQSWLFKNYDRTRDGALFLAEKGNYYGMPLIRDTYGISYAAGASKPDTLSGLAGGSLLGAMYDGGLTQTFLALLVAQGSTFIRPDGTLAREGLVSSVAQDLLNTMHVVYHASGTMPQIGRTEYLRRAAAADAQFAPLPGTSANAYATIYTAHFVEGSTNPRAARELIAWLGTEFANDMLQEENGMSLVGSVRDASRARAHNATQHEGAAPIRFFITQSAEAMLSTADTYLTAYFDGTTKFTAQETLETIAVAWEKELKNK